MDEDLFDEFGNPIAELAIDSSDEVELSSSEESEMNNSETEEDKLEDEIDKIVDETALIPSSMQATYGDEVEILVETENTQSINEPLVKPDEGKSKGSEYSLFSHIKKNIPETSYDREYMLQLLSVPERIRNVAVIGPLHSGKTSLVDLLVLESHKKMPFVTKNVEQGWRSLRYMDNLKQEVERGMSLKLNGFTFLTTDLNDKSMVINLIDSPGHVDFMDDTAVALEASDIVIICVDIVEGVTSVVEKMIKLCQSHHKKVIFVLNKIDRLILELKLPPMDTYLKLKHTVARINSFSEEEYSPELGNVIFASSKIGFTFSLKEFVQYYYSDKIPNKIVESFVRKLWGDYHYSNGKFVKITDPTTETPTFYDFIILPIYKIFTYTLTLSEKTLPNLTKMLNQNFHIDIKSPEYLLKIDPLPLLREVCKLVFGVKQTGLSHSIINLAIDSLPLPHLENEGGLIARALKTLDYGGNEYTLLRVYHGILKVGMTVNIMNAEKDYDEDEEDDSDIDNCTITEIALMGGRYTYNIGQAGVNQLVLVKNVSNYFDKGGIIYSGISRNMVPRYGKIDYINSICFKVIIEPLVPKELPKLMDALIKINKYYPGVITKVEESGEHVILGFGELYLDCLLYDLRNNYAQIEIKISDPVTIFSESVNKESFTAIPVTSSNGNITLSVSAKPLDQTFLKDLSQNELNEFEIENEIASGNTKKLAKKLRTNYGWDSLAARNVWTFYNSNVFVDDTLPDETDKDTLNKYKQQIKQGFYWSVREGPLCEENIYGTQFNLLNFNVQNENENRNIGSQLIPMIRKACYIGFMTAQPAIMEPIYEVDVIVKSTLIPIVEELFRKRRGARIYRVEKIVGSPLSEVKGQIPVIESIGFETDLRISTSGGGMCQLHFWNKIWRKVPGNVLDEDAIIPKLKPAPMGSLSRDFVMKTRRRKGISSDGFMSKDGPSLGKYIDPELFEQLKANELI